VPQPVTILIVEDEQDQLTIMTHMLSRAGYRVVPAYGAADAIRKTKTQKIDLVVTDLAMPEVSGVEVVHAVKADPATRHIPVIVVTAHIWDELGQAASQMRPDGFITKPCTAARLLREIDKHLKPSRP
jgi:CheY-like chemotaxis protein